MNYFTQQNENAVSVVDEAPPKPRQITAVANQFDKLMPQSMRDMIDLADMVAGSDLAPKAYQGKPGNCLVAFQMGAEVGLRPMQALQNIAVINGIPGMYGDALPAVVKSHPDYRGMSEGWHKDDNGNVIGAWCKVKRKNEGEVLREFYLDDAQAAGLLSKAGPWKQYRPRMLQMRARAWALRDSFPDALRGIRVLEEIIGHDVVDGEFVTEEAPKVAMPRSRSEAKPAPDQTATEAQVGTTPNGDPIKENHARMIRAKLQAKGKEETALCEAFKVDCLDSLTIGQLNDALTWAQS